MSIENHALDSAAITLYDSIAAGQSFASPTWDNWTREVAYIASTPSGPELQSCADDQSYPAVPCSSGTLVQSRSSHSTQYPIIATIKPATSDAYALYGISTKSIRCLVEEANTFFFYGDTSPDGSHIATTRYRQGDHTFAVIVVDLTTLQQVVVHEDQQNISVRHWYSETRLLCLRHLSTGIEELLTVDISSRRTLTHLSVESRIRQPIVDVTENRVLCLTDADSEFLRLASLALDESKKLTFLTSDTHDIETYAYLDTNALLLGANVDSATHLSLHGSPSSLLKSPLLEVTDTTSLTGDGVITGLQAIPGGGAVFTYSDHRNPASVWMYEARHVSPIRGDDRVESKCSDVRLEHHIYKGEGGLPLGCWEYSREGRAGDVAVVYVHGGPDDQARPSYDVTCSWLAMLGVTVLRPNIRGSSGYGRTFSALDNGAGRWRAMRDISLLGDLLKDRFKHVVVMGGSYGGYMALCMAGFYPGVWAGAICFSGFASVTSFLERTAIGRRSSREAEYGSLDTDRGLLDSLSPLFRLDGKVPLLLFHGRQDTRVEVREIEDVASQVRSVGGEVDLTVFDSEAHAFLSPDSRRVVHQKVAMFIEQLNPGASLMFA